ncbi:TPA: hypothetical protein ACX3JG_001573 [Raoultella ornithinolytica]
MAYLPEQPEWTDGVYQLEKSDPVRGGVDGPANRPLIDLLKRTAWLKQRYEEAFSGLGWAELGEWAVGLEVTTPSQIVHYQGYWYRYGGSLPHTITGASPSLDDNDNWFNLGNDVSLRANLGSGEEGMGANLVAMFGGGTVASTLAFAVTPERFGAKGDGIHDDTQAIIDARDYCLANGINELRGRGIYLITDSIGCKSNRNSSNPLLHFRMELAVVVIDDQWDALPTDWWNAKPAFYSAGNSSSASASLENFELVVHAFYGNWRAHFFEVKGGGMSTSRICCNDPRNYIIGYKCIGSAAAQSTMNRIVGRLWQSGYIGVLIGGRWNGTGSGNTECHTIDIQWFATNRYGGIVTSDAARFINVMTGTFDYNGKYSSMLSLTGLSTGDGPQNESGNRYVFEFGATVKSSDGSKSSTALNQLIWFNGAWMLHVTENGDVTDKVSKWAVGDVITNASGTFTATISAIQLPSAASSGPVYFDVVMSQRNGGFSKGALITNYVGRYWIHYDFTCMIWAPNSTGGRQEMSFKGFQVLSSYNHQYLYASNMSWRTTPWLDISEDGLLFQQPITLEGRRLIGNTFSGTLEPGVVTKVMTFAAGTNSVPRFYTVSVGSSVSSMRGQLFITAFADSLAVKNNGTSNITITTDGLNLYFSLIGSAANIYLNSIRN